VPAVAGVAVAVDPRIELVQIVMFLTGLQEKTRQPVLKHQYTDAVQRWFASTENHPAVKTAARLIGERFIHPKPNRLMLLLGLPPDLPEIFPVARYNDLVKYESGYIAEVLQDWVESGIQMSC
jgi:hypothetical protein